MRDAIVTIVLVGSKTKLRKHIDWETYSSMFDGKLNKKSGILAVNLPSIDNGNVLVGHGEEEKVAVYPEYRNWQTWTRRAQFEEKFPYVPSRIINNLVHGAKISVTRWELLDAAKLRFLVDTAYEYRRNYEYDLSALLRRKNK